MFLLSFIILPIIFNLLNIWDSNQVFFVVHHKEYLQYTVVKELDLPDNRHQHILKALKAMAKYNWHLSNLMAFIRLNLFVKIELQLWFDKLFEQPPEHHHQYIRGFFDFST